jgi:hypothetical protein
MLTETREHHKQTCPRTRLLLLSYDKRILDKTSKIHRGDRETEERQGGAQTWFRETRTKGFNKTLQIQNKVNKTEFLKVSINHICIKNLANIASHHGITLFRSDFVEG